MLAVLCASLCNCRHIMRADDEELVEVVLEHLRHNHPRAPLREERARKIDSSRAYEIEYARVDAGTSAKNGSSVPSLIRGCYELDNKRLRNAGNGDREETKLTVECAFLCGFCPSS